MRIADHQLVLRGPDLFLQEAHAGPHRQPVTDAVGKSGDQRLIVVECQVPGTGHVPGAHIEHRRHAEPEARSRGVGDRRRQRVCQPFPEREPLEDEAGVVDAQRGVCGGQEFPILQSAQARRASAKGTEVGDDRPVGAQSDGPRIVEGLPRRVRPDRHGQRTQDENDPPRHATAAPPGSCRSMPPARSTCRSTGPPRSPAAGSPG